ncbi:MAG: stomatin-like protein [Cyanobacteria bacterium P01_G01_bin.54]
MGPFFLLILSTAIGGGLLTILNSLKIISEGNEALVERTGKYDRKLSSGLNMVLPFLETIVVEDTIREKVLEIEPQDAISKDNVSLKVDAVVYWKIIDLERTYYVVEDIKDAIKNLVLTTLRSQIGLLELDETYSSRQKINQALIEQLDEATEAWGVKVTRIEVRKISPAPSVMESLELERAAESKKQAEILEIQGRVRSIQELAKALGPTADVQQILDYLIAQRYIEANEKLGDSANAKIVFMDPRALDEAVTDLMKKKPGAALPSPDVSGSNGVSSKSGDPSGDASAG